MLESRGIRGERILDLAALCAALEVPISELLKGDSHVEADDPSVDPAPGWVAAALEGRVRDSTSQTPLRAGLVQGIAKDDPEDVSRLARGFDIEIDLLRKFSETVSGQPSPTVLRDYLAQLLPDMSREEARIARGRASRELKSLLDLWEGSSNEWATGLELQGFESWLEKVLHYESSTKDPDGDH